MANSVWAGKRKLNISNRAESQPLSPLLPPYPHTLVTSMRKWIMSALLLSTACMRGLWPLLMSWLEKKSTMGKVRGCKDGKCKKVMLWNLVRGESVKHRDWPWRWCQPLHPAAFWPNLCGHAAQPDGEGSNLWRVTKQNLVTHTKKGYTYCLSTEYTILTPHKVYTLWGVGKTVYSFFSWCAWNTLSAVPPLILWLCDITMCQNITHSYNLSLAATLTRKFWFSQAALLLLYETTDVFFFCLFFGAMTHVNLLE